MKICKEWSEWLVNENILTMRQITGEWKHIENEMNGWSMKIYGEWGEWLGNENILRMRWMTRKWKYIEN